MNREEKAFAKGFAEGTKQMNKQQSTLEKERNNAIRRAVELEQSKGERKLRQDMHKPMVIEDKKKEAKKKHCRSKEYGDD